jgi:hypothetical protein
MHFEVISNGMGGPSMYMMVLAGQKKIMEASRPARSLLDLYKEGYCEF